MTLHVTSGIADTDRTRFTADYRAYLAAFGRAIGSTHDEPDTRAATCARPSQSRRTCRPPSTRAASTSSPNASPARPLRYDLVIVTNVFPYLSDPELIVAIANIAAVLAPGGALIHNEPRPLLQSTAASIGLPAIHARSVLIATVPGGNDLYDAIWIHQKR